VKLRRAPRGALVRARRASSAVAREVATEVDRVRYRRRGGADLALFHELVPPPTGGGHQFLRALIGELERREVEVELNRISRGTPACLFNSFNFDFRRLRRFARADVRMVHRVDGPIGVYRGFDDGTDARIAEINAELANATVVQSRYSLDAHRELGIELRDPTIVVNTVDPSIFHPPVSREPLAGRRVRVIATSWSDNPNKGTDVLGLLDRELDYERYELTFAGRTDEPFERMRLLGAVTSDVLAEELRRSDVYLAPSRNDPCSNALLEALACGLPAVFRASGGHPELVGDAGIPFEQADEVLEALARVVAELDERRAAIRIAPLAEVADRYLEVLRG
jgi:glycosyltransferase involved in cell wall biosynthesis